MTSDISNTASVVRPSASLKQREYQLNYKSIKAFSKYVPLFVLYPIFKIEYGDETFWPSTLAVGAFVASLLIVSFIRSSYCRWIFAIWQIWFVLGVLSYPVASLDDVSWTRNVLPNIEPFASIYTIFLLAASAGALLGPRFLPSRPARTSERKSHKYVTAGSLCLLLFPVLYLASMVISYGKPPILSGSDYYDDLYGLNLGPLYSFAIITATSSILVFMQITKRLSVSNLLGYFPYLLFCLFAATAEGKRLNMMIALIAIAFLILPKLSRRGSFLIIALGGGFAAFMLTLVHLIRTGFRGSDFASSFYQIFSMGTEFRDSIFTTYFYTPEIANSFGYNWFGSTIGSLVNSTALQLIGVDKNALVSHDSARTFMAILDQRFGIRLGLITELWFAYGWWGLIPIFVVGVLVAYLSFVAENEKDDIKKSFLLTVVANWTMAMMGQSSVLFGTLPTLLYVFFAVAIVDRMFPNKKRQ